MRSLVLAAAFGLLCVSSYTSLSQEQSASDAYKADPKFVAAMTEAKTLTQERKLVFAEDAYRKANKISAGRCSDCWLGLYKLQMSLMQFKEAISSAEAMEKLAASDTDKAIVEYRHASAIFSAAGDKPKPTQLETAHDLLTDALHKAPKAAALLYLDGTILARMGKLEEAKAEFTQCISCISPKDPARLRAQHFAEDPELSLHKMAPAFEVTALDGNKFNLDAMGGRVVLIDFWATWCGPCNEELPNIKKIAQDFSGQPLVIISVSWDSDEAKWKQFITKNNMTWVQYRDADHALAKLFGIDAIPHYFTIDSDGVLTSEISGSGSNVEGKLKKLIAKARESQKQVATMSELKAHQGD